MKKLSVCSILLLLLAACSSELDKDNTIIGGKTMTVSFEPVTRAQFDSDQQTVWNKGDLVSVFYKQDAVEKWTYMGEEGASSGPIKRSEVNPGNDIDKSIVVYPYSPDYVINTSANTVSAILPSTQHYKADSFGEGGNIMVATSQDNNFTMKSVVGWLKLQLVGDKTIRKIQLYGNDAEKDILSGPIEINYETLAINFVSEEGSGDSETGSTLVDNVCITLDCGEGVALSADPTSFYIALPPHTFTNGLNIALKDTEGQLIMTKSTANPVEIQRRNILPMEQFTVGQSPEDDQEPGTLVNGVAKLTEAGTLATVLGDQMLTLTSLKVIGEINGTDVNCLRQMLGGSEFESTQLGKLNTLNLTEASIVEGGDYYYQIFDKKYYTSFNSIGAYMFRECIGLQSIQFPNNVTSIEENVFYECSSLNNVIISSNVTSIGGWAFYGCSSLKSINIPDGVTTIEEWAFMGCSSLESITIPESITSIENSTFSGCSGLTSIIIPESVTTIGNSAFSGCSGLTSITLPEGITSIERSTFENCSSLESIIIPKGVTTIGEWAFGACSNLTSITLPESVTSIGISAFQNCSGLTSIIIPESVTTIGQFAFFGCSNLKSVTLPESLTSIENSTFEDCSSLESIIIPKDVTTIGQYAFYNCSRLTYIYCKSITPPSLDSSNYFSSAQQIYVPTASVDAYKAASEWSKYASIIAGYDF